MSNGQIVYKINDEFEIKLSKEIVEMNCAGGNAITDEAFTQFAALCKQHKLNPFTREAHIVVMKSANGTTRYNIMIGKDGYFKMADSNPNYDGMQDGIVIEDKNGNILYPEGCFVPPGCKLLAGWARAYSKERKYPKYVVCSLSEYKGSDKSLWATKPATMINKVAKCAALRDLFPQTYNGTYDEYEINNLKDDETNKITKPTTQKAEAQETVKSEAKAETKTVEKEEPKISLKDALNTKINKLTIQQMIDACQTKQKENGCKTFLKQHIDYKTEFANACDMVLKAIEKGLVKFKNVKA